MISTANAAPSKTTKEDEEEIQGVTDSLAVAKATSITAVAALFLELGKNK